VSAATQRVVLLGGSSEIGQAIVRRLAADRPVAAALVGRDAERLSRAAAELRAGAQVEATVIAGALDSPVEQETAMRRAAEALGGVELVVLAVGLLGGQEGVEADPAQAAEVMRVNFVLAGGLVQAALRELSARSAGTLVVLSSVAGVRVRASNPFYGAAKAGLDALAVGLGDAARERGVRTVVVRPGFVTGRMTAGLPSPPLATLPVAVAEATVRGLAAGRDTVWAPGELRILFTILRALPRTIWRRLPL
jgi:decaprenylphospho-beta-D-erythro-pentofuranosid-2-ulose 2-reductase